MPSDKLPRGRATVEFRPPHVPATTRFSPPATSRLAWLDAPPPPARVRLWTAVT